MRSDNSSSFAYAGPGNGSTQAEQFTAYHPGDLANATLIAPGESAVLQNQGMWCRLAPLPPQVHGSVLFTRGETQSLATTVLGDDSMVSRYADCH